jgi:hypothetical protein
VGRGCRGSQFSRVKAGKRTLSGDSGGHQCSIYHQASCSVHACVSVVRLPHPRMSWLRTCSVAGLSSKLARKMGAPRHQSMDVIFTVRDPPFPSWNTTLRPRGPSRLTPPWRSIVRACVRDAAGVSEGLCKRACSHVCGCATCLDVHGALGDAGLVADGDLIHLRVLPCTTMHVHGAADARQRLLTARMVTQAAHGQD